MGKVQVFLDADVVIASLLSKTGASFEIINHPKVQKTISKTVKKEIIAVSKRLVIESQKREIVFKSVNLINLGVEKSGLIRDYQRFVFDRYDSHVVAGAKAAKSRFLLTHNLKHYRVDKIKADLGIIVTKPGNFLQYLRSLN